MDKMDAFDVILEPENAGRTSNLKRRLALKLAAQRVRDIWYSYPNAAALRKALMPKPDPMNPGKFLPPEFDPSRVLYDTLLELLGSVDAKTLDILRDVGVGSPQMGIAGIGVATQTTNPPPSSQENEKI